jgi:predicted RNA-binding protein with PUA-like domain
VKAEMRYWLFKSEPNAYSFDDLVEDGVAEWDGVRSFQARNYLKNEIQEGDGVLFYHSSVKPMAVVGTATVVKAGYPDHTAWNPSSEHPDPKSTPEKPIWYMVDIAPRERFSEPVTLDEMRREPRLAKMALLRRGMRLSVQPVTEEEWEVVQELGNPVPVASPAL